MKKLFIVISLFFVSLHIYAQQKPLTTKDIFSRPYMIGKRPSGASISPDGKWVTFLGNFKGTDTLYLHLVSSDGKNLTKISSKKGSNNVQWRKDGESFLFREDNEIWVYQISSGKKSKLIQYDGFEGSVTETDDKSQLSFMSEGKLISVQNKDPRLSQSKYKIDQDVNAFMVGRIGQTGNFVIGYSKDDSVTKNLVPQWMKENVYTTESERGSISYFRYLKVSSDTSASVNLISKKMFSGYGGETDISKDGKYFAYSNISVDQHFRYVVLVDLSTSKADTILAQQDTAWISTKGGMQFSPDSKYLAFTHDKSNWNHIYLYELAKKTTVPLTSGDWEIDWFNWNPENANELFLTSTQSSPNDRPIYKMNIKTSKIEQLSETEGMRDNLAVSDDGSKIVYSKNNLKDPGDLFVLDVSKKTETRITNTVPESFKNYELNFPSLVQIQNPRLKENFPAHVFYPKNYDKSKKYPAVIFVHGAGYLQNVANQFGYGSYWREYLFNQYLTQKGYVVMNIDFHGSEGYGRKNRISIYKDMGGADWEDEVAAANWLVEKGLADKEKIGIYGGSYGGFLTMMGLFKSPDVFKAGAGLRSVANWELYNKWYCEQRLGPLSSNKKIYEKCSPITYADSLKNHLLILHGMVDSNVLFQDVVQLSDKLIKLNKKFDVMYYPRENHSFTEPENWQHEYEEIEAHFDRYLK